MPGMEFSTSSFSRRSRCGLSSLLSWFTWLRVGAGLGLGLRVRLRLRLKHTCSDVPPPVESFPNFSRNRSTSLNLLPSRKLRMDQSSATWFCSGVPGWGE
eukprot:scaffold87710_cov42-Phaeocystis_antarctica.AAC.1